MKDRKAEGAAILMVEIRNGHSEPLTEEKLFEWHRTLLPDSKVSTDVWRTNEAPMQVVSCGYGREMIHFEAPPSSRVPDEMKAFIEWFNNTTPKGAKEIQQASVRSAIAHLYFESIHPFEEGN